jgi:GT2 family glycosyltransferase
MTGAICFVTALYHDAARVRGFVHHVQMLPRPKNVTLHALVADNGSEARPVWIPDAEVYTSDCNRGYFGGCAWALEQRHATSGVWPDWICVSNSDLELADDFLERLFSVPIDENVGVIAPSVRLPSGAQQNPLLWRRPSPLMMLAYALLTRSALFSISFESFIHVRHQVRRLLETREPGGDSGIYAPHGSIVLLHRRFFERGGSLRYGGLMYGEEIHLAEQARRASLGVMWRRDLAAVHRQHATTALVPRAQRRAWQAHSAEVLWRDYFAGQ